MKQHLTEPERDRLDRLIEEAERLTRTEIVLATVQRSDTYAEIPWKAFAIGISMAGLLVFVANLVLMPWVTDTLVLVSLACMLSAGMLLAGLTLVSPGMARLFLTKQQRETETRQYAESLFLNRELFATEGRLGILLLVSLFERQVVILPDKGLRERFSTDSLEGIIREMAPLLRKSHVAQALETGVKLFQAQILQVADGNPDNELSNEIIGEDGK